MLEIVNGNVEQTILLKSKLFKEDNIISFDLMLNIGDICNLEIIKNRNVCNKRINVDKKIKILLSKVKENEDIRFWYSSINSEDVCFISYALYLINKHYSNKNIMIIDAYDKNMPTLGSFLLDEIKELLNIEKKLSNEVINDLVSNWKKLENQNSNLRLLNNGKLESFSYNYLDTKILNALSKYDEVDIYSFVGIEFMPKGFCSIYGDLIFHYRIKELIKLNKIKIVRSEIKKDLFGFNKTVEIIKNNVL